MKPTPIVQANKYWLVRDHEILVNTRENTHAPDFKTMNVGLQKRLSFNTIRTKHQASLDMLPCASTQLRGNSTHQHLNEITKNKQGKAVQLIFDMKERL